MRIAELLRDIYYELFRQNLLRIELSTILSFVGILLLTILMTSVLIASSLLFFKLI